MFNLTLHACEISPFIFLHIFLSFHFHCDLTNIQLTTTTSTDQPVILLTTENLKNNREYSELFNNLVSEYDRRLEEQVKFAKQDMLRELEVQIQVSTN